MKPGCFCYVGFVALMVSHIVIAGDARPSDDSRVAARLRVEATLQDQRRFAWQALASLVTEAGMAATPAFESWRTEADTLGPERAAARALTGMRGFAATPGSAFLDAHQSADSPIFTVTFYNPPAFAHIRRNRLYLREELKHLQFQGAVDESIAGDRAVPAFPAESLIVKSAWWPVAQQGVTALPVWDPNKNERNIAGISYLNWKRVVAIDPDKHPQTTVPTLSFAARIFHNVRRIDLSSFYHVRLSPELAEQIMQDQTARKQTAVVLGRGLRAGDYLVLVAANMASRVTRDWVWTAVWWHDQPTLGEFSDGRPDNLPPEWRHYLLQVAFDASTPRAADGSDHICFNPWLEGRFPDGGQGSGTESNCLACHARATFPSAGFLPVTRGAPRLQTDPAYQAGVLRTSFLWSIALRAQP